MTADPEFTTTPRSTQDTVYLDRPQGRIAYELVGSGPLVVLSPGMADTRRAYRFLAPMLADAGYTVASVDLRGHGDSSTGWDSYSHVDTAGDLLELIGALGGPAAIVGQSFSGAAATIAAATNPELVSAIVEVDPFTRPPKYSAGAFVRNSEYRRGALLLGRFAVTGNVGTWAKYLDMAYPGRKPADWDAWLAELQSNLREPGRVKAVRRMMSSSATLKQAGAQLAQVRCPALVIMGADDSDWPDPEAEAAAIAGLLAAGRYEMIDHAGHYPHAQYPRQVADAIVSFLAESGHA